MLKTGGESQRPGECVEDTDHSSDQRKNFMNEDGQSFLPTLPVKVFQPPGLALLAHPRKHKSPLIQKRANPDAQAREQSACLTDSQNNNRTTFPRHYHRGVLDGLDAGWDGMLLYAYHTIRKYTYKYKPRRVLTTFTHLAFAG
ncbi:hypothetical protein AXG93_2446s1070 [Marchantia polymorpha subsp. ruderalis]|uniref:Uncharacterized protein n=1 Tax=Marchantia polymorpha subsp. ruderalis TaxID=1480154 RepID=A0A176W8M7_MARPO|nr:hypothetical protein AXG93_2446s1070 [Marchantia polymorpha subsp. ruderalis]